MSSDQPAAVFRDVWKKYSRDPFFHRSLREDVVNIFKVKPETGLAKNEFWALKGIDFSIKSGETVGLYGPNGSGKSTILKLLAGVTCPTQGTVKVNGRVAPLLEIGAGFHLDLTGRENIFVNGAILGMKIKEIRQKLSSIIEFAEISEFIDMPVKKYSSGMYVRLAFAIAVHSAADIYLIDEVIAAGDEGFRNKCLQKIKSLKAKDGTVLLVTHDKFLLEALADRVLLLETGKIKSE